MSPSTTAGAAEIQVKLTIEACPMRSRIVEDVAAAAVRAEGVTTAEVDLHVMSPEERAALKEQLRAGGGRTNPSRTRTP